MSLTAVFDIGKTNKKFFIFDEQFTEVEGQTEHFEEVTDEDGFPCDDLKALTVWMRSTFDSALAKYGDRITHLNFSTYGASFVHLDKTGNPATALYNYLKPFPEDLLEKFYHKYGDAGRFSLETASPALGMLNSGLQLFWLKYAHPERFARIHSALHLPQFFSFLFTGRPFCEYTSIGCHTGLWDFEANNYHRWVREENLLRLFPEIVETTKNINIRYKGYPLTVGVGIHDSSAALLPYLFADAKPFILVSTGTWSITLNPFSREMLTVDELARDCLNYLRPDGKTVKASRLFLGQEHETQARDLCRQFGKPPESCRQVRMDAGLYRKVAERAAHVFSWRHLPLSGNVGSSEKGKKAMELASFEEAYHQLMFELVSLQTDSIRLAMGSTHADRVYIDGGFVENDLFLNMLADQLKGMEVVAAETSQGSALGAAMAVRNAPLPERFLTERFNLRPID